MPASQATQGWKAQIFLAVSPSTTMTNEALTDSGTHTTYNDATAAHADWDDSVATTVQTSPDGSTWTTALASTYVINYPIGQVVFNAANAPGTQVRVTGKYFTSNFFGFCRGYDLSPAAQALECTTMKNPPSPWKDFTGGELGADVKLTHYWIDGTMFGYLSAGSRLILALYPDAVGAPTRRWQGYVVLKTEDVKVLTNAVSTDDLTFSFKGQPYLILS